MLVIALSIACLLLAGLAGWAVLAGRRTSAQFAALVETQSKAEAATRYCGLTGLANGQRAVEWLEEALAAKGSRPAILRVAFVPFSESPERESKLARIVADILGRVAPGKSLMGRLGPGDYLLALDGVALGSGGLVTTARAAGGRLSQLLSDARRIRIGVALAIGGDTPDSLLERAAQAVHLCPPSEPLALAYMDVELRNEVESRTLAAVELSEAIAAGRIEPFFQPFVELSTGRVLGFEVLARWRDDHGRLRMPCEFLPLAEDSGLIEPMYRALLKKAAAEAKNWPSDWTFALNLSARQLCDATLVESTIRSLHEAGIATDRFEIEIAEQALQQDPESALAVVRGFRSRGIKVVLDNFGAGNLHLRDLSRFPFDRIKVDPRALCGEGREPDAALGLIAAAARHLGVPVQVQGIETHARAEAAQVNGCAIGQGFLFGRPGRRTEYFRLEGALAASPAIRHRAA